MLALTSPGWKEASAKKLGGTWYSSVSAGYGSAWHVAEVVKRVSKSCADEAMNSAVEKAGFASGCFQKCGPHSTGSTRNTSSTCWIECFESTVLGPDAGTPGGAIAGMALEDLVAAWNAPFDSDNPQLSGVSCTRNQLLLVFTVPVSERLLVFNSARRCRCRPPRRRSPDCSKSEVVGF